MTVERSVTANIIEIYTEATRGGGERKVLMGGFDRSDLMTDELRGSAYYNSLYK